MTPGNDDGRPRHRTGPNVDTTTAILEQEPDITPLARHLLRRVPAGADIPSYGSWAWSILPDQDPRRAASVIVAAECWRDHRSPQRVAVDLRGQLAEEDAAVWRRIRETSWDVSAAADWGRASSRPTWAELESRRAS